MTTAADYGATLGVSAIVRAKKTDPITVIRGYQAGDAGMVVQQHPGNRYRYGVMFPGDTHVYWFQPHDLELVQGVDLENWWVQHRRRKREAQ